MVRVYVQKNAKANAAVVVAHVIWQENNVLFVATKGGLGRTRVSEKSRGLTERGRLVVSPHAHAHDSTRERTQHRRHSNARKITHTNVGARARKPIHAHKHVDDDGADD